MDVEKRKQNERKFERWEELQDGGRIYYFEIKGKAGWKARYVKEVNADEKTIRFYQEIFDEKGNLVEIHKKYPQDYGHRKMEG